MNEKKPCDFCKGTGIEPGHTDCAWCDNTGVHGATSPAPVPPAVPAAWDDKALELAGKAYQQINAYPHRDRGYLVSVIQCSIILGMKFSQPHSPAAPDGEIELPKLDSLADIAYANETPSDWDNDYRKIWQELQVASRNKTQLGGHIRELRSKLSQAIAQRDEGLAREAELQSQLAKQGDDYCKRIDELITLQQRLAEAEKKIDGAVDLLRRAKQMIPVLQYNWHANTNALLASPGCADGGSDCPSCDSGILKQDSIGKSWACSVCDFISPESDGGLDGEKAQ